MTRRDLEQPPSALRRPPLHAKFPPMSEDPALTAWLRERDAVLRDPDLARLRAHLAKYGSPAALQASDETMRVTWHKARAACTSLSRAERRTSIRWLEERGFAHLGDDALEGENETEH